MSPRHSIAVVATLVGASLLAPTPTSARHDRDDDYAGTIHCESHHGRYRYCSVDQSGFGGATAVEDLLLPRRQQGYDRHGIWVDEGCGADFRVAGGHKHGHDDDDDHGPAIAAGAAVAGIALIAALAAQSDRTSDDVSASAIGSFAGYDEIERSDVAITILPGGSVRGSAGGNAFTGRLDGSRLGAGHYTLTIERSGNGFIASDERNSRHRVVNVISVDLADVCVVRTAAQPYAMSPPRR
jgi:hypothetical protein